MSLPNNYVCEGQISIFDLGIWCGKTSQELLAPTTEKISERSLKRPQKWQKGMPAFLDLRGGKNGQQQDASWEMGGPLLGEYTMRSFGECPSVENASLLSQILEVTPHPKYSLSAKACQGILRRAESRGKKLPEQLEEALRRQSVSKNELENRGGGKGILIQNERTGALSTLNNQSVCTNYKADGADGKGVAFATVGDHESRPTDMTNLVIEPQTYQKTTGGTVDREPILLESNQNHATIQTDGISTALPASMGMGGGYVPMVMEQSTYQKTTGALMASGYDKLGTQEAANDMYVVQSNWDGSQVAPTLTSNNAGGNQRMPDKDNFNAVIVYGLDRASFNQGKNAQYDFSIEEDLAQPGLAKGWGGVLTHK